jgi:hypothetical protein
LSRIGSIDGFARAHPRLWASFANDAKWNSYRTGSGISGEVLEALDDAGRELLAAAIVLSLILRIPREDIERILLRASEELSAEAPSRQRPQ